MFVVVLGALLVGALAAGTASSKSTSGPAAVNVAPNAAALTASSTAWFCPGLPPVLAHGGGRVTFANVGAVAADVVVTDLADKGAATHVPLSVPPNTVVTRTRDQLGGPGALTVEAFGGRIVVEEGIEGAGALETTPCATQSAPHWYFAAGTTPRGVQQWLVIDNPYASDAKVDVTLRTSSGVRKPDALQSLDVARRSREVIPIHDIAVRQDRVAVAVDVSVGAVVAAQTIVYTTAAGPAGVAHSLGSPVTAPDWTFAGAVGHAGSTAVVAIVNVGNDTAQVDVQATPDSSKEVPSPATLTVAQDDVAWVQLGHCTAASTGTGTSAKACISVPDGVPYSLDIRSEQNVPVVAQTLTHFDDAPNVVGAVTSPGGIQPARAWTFARSVVGGERTTTLSFFNPGAEPSIVKIAFVHEGQVGHPPTVQHLTVPPGRAITVSVVGGRKPPTRDAALLVDASQPVFAQRLIVAADEVSSSVGVVVG
ncbi:MAG: hypothetical protein JWM72_1468 [Actinomycetia bacterium]|nr:hypothetical protein [Actinomycetes bacterium]